MKYCNRPENLKHVSIDQWHFYDKDSEYYEPTMEELGILPKDEVNLKEEVQDRLVKEWRVKHKQKMLKKLERKNILKQIDIKNHWYNTINDFDFDCAINNSRKYGKDYILDINLSESLDAKRKYNQALIYKVESLPFKRRIVDSKKILKFPKYDVSKNELYGSKYSFYVLWCHVFSNKR